MQTFILCAICAVLGLYVGAIFQANKEFNYKKQAEYYKERCKKLTAAMKFEIKEIKRGADDEK